MEPVRESRMSGLHPNRSLTSFCLLAAVATPILAFVTQFAAAPFYPGYSFTLLSGSMLGTHFSRAPWVFNAGEILTGFAAIAGALGLYQSFRRKTNILVSGIIAFSVACTGVLTLKAGMFPMPDPRHNSWGPLFNFIILIPFVMLIGLWKQSPSSGLRTYLISNIVFLLLLIPMTSWLGRGTLQRLIAVGTLFPVGVVGFFFWRELHGDRSGPSDSISPSPKSFSSPEPF
jgi:hypothetical membrane protein